MELTTRAAVLRTPGERLAIETLQVVPPGPGEVLVQLGASGICGTDSSNAKNATIKSPIVLGHEGAGVVVAVGDHVSQCALGDHVVLSLISQCGKCRWCVNGQPHLCGPGALAQRAGTLPNGRSSLRNGDEEVFQFLGLGTFSEKIVVPETAVVPIPKNVPFEVAALMGCGVMTGLGAALRSAPVPRGGTTLVVGCGGVGMNIIQGARLAGADRIIGIDPVSDKEGTARKLGATDFGPPERLTQIVAEVTNEIGVDVAFDVVGSAKTAQACLDATRRGGQTCIVGAKYGEILPLNITVELIGGAKTMCGCHYGSSFVLRDIPQAVSALASGSLDLASVVSRTIPLDDVNTGLELIAKADGLRTVIVYPVRNS